MTKLEEKLMKKLELARVGNGTQTYNDVVLTLSKEETLELLKYIEQLEKEKQINERLIKDNVEFLDKYLKTQDKYQKLKKRYKKRAELSNELCKALNKYEKVFEILIDKFKFELGVSVVKEKYCYSLEFLFNNQYFRITKEQYELLKQVFESVGDSDE